MSRFLIVYKALETLAVGLLLCPRRPPPLLRSTPLPLHRRRPLRSSAGGERAVAPLASAARGSGRPGPPLPLLLRGGDERERWWCMARVAARSRRSPLDPPAPHAASSPVMGPEERSQGSAARGAAAP